MAVESVNYSTILIEVNKAVKMHNFYPQGHPQLVSALEKAFNTIKNALKERSEIKWKIDLKGFYDERVPIAPGNPEILGLAKRLYLRKIKELTVTQSVTLSDMKTLISIIKMEQEEIIANGGLERIFAEKNVTGILFNEVRYEDLKKLRKELEERRHDEEKVIAETSEKKEEKPAPAGEAAQAKDSESEPPEPRQEIVEEELHALIDKIRGERDFLLYNDLSVRILERSQPFVAEKSFDEVFPALEVFLEHSAGADMPEDISKTARERLHSYFSLDMLKYLVERAGLKDEHNRKTVQRLLVEAGGDAPELLLDAVIEAPEATSRKHLYGTILRFGPSIRPSVEKRLGRPEWYAVRQMVSLLGDINDPASLDALEQTYLHPEPRVKKEVLKTLVKIKSPRTTEILLRALEEEDESLVNQAIISLSVIKDPSAAEAIGRIAQKWEPFADKQDSKKQAIKALGVMKAPGGIPYLTSVLFKKAWFGKKANEEVRILSANALAMIGTEEAYKAIEQACAGSTGELYDACKRILDGREKKS